MQIRVTSTDHGTLIVSRTDGSGQPRAKAVEVPPGGFYRGYKFRRLRRWADDGQDHTLYPRQRRDLGRNQG